MPQERKFDSGHAIVPVMHPSGELHAIAVPEGVRIADFHGALEAAGYHFPQPKKEGALEYSPAFRDAAAKAIMASHNYTGQEAGFALRADGTPARNVKGEPVIQSSKEFGKGHNLKVLTQAGDMGILHTHPDNPRPSPGDIEDAKANHMTIYAASPEGLWAVDPGGSVSQVFQSRTWFSDKNPR